MRGREQLFGRFCHALVLCVDFNLFEVFFELVQVSVPDLGDSARFARGYHADAVHCADQDFELLFFHVRSPIGHDPPGGGPCFGLGCSVFVLVFTVEVVLVFIFVFEEVHVEPVHDGREEVVVVAGCCFGIELVPQFQLARSSQGLPTPAEAAELCHI